MRDNPKRLGEKGQLVAIGELAKWDIQVAFPLSDNLPFDLILIHNNKLYKTQVKSSTQSQRGTSGSISFKLTTSNWHRKTSHKYTKEDTDVMLLCDYENVYLLGPDEFVGRRSFSIRQKASRNNQSCNVNDAKDFVLSAKRIDEVLT